MEQTLVARREGVRPQAAKYADQFDGAIGIERRAGLVFLAADFFGDQI